jgi:O-6-methylguanine DNA methyltransferase
MRCREVEALWDDVRCDGAVPLREAVVAHLRNCPPCQGLFEEYEGVAFCLSSLPLPEPSCDLAKRVVEHIAAIKRTRRMTPIVLTAVLTPIGRLYVGYKEERVAFVGIDRGESMQRIREQIERRLRRPVEMGDAPGWLAGLFERFFQTWQFDEGHVDLSDLTPFEQAALRAAIQIPRGQTRSYAWVAREIGKPRAARAVGQAMARNPLPVIVPCHRVVDSQGELHNYGYGIEMKARLLKLEGYER